MLDREIGALVSSIRREGRIALRGHALLLVGSRVDDEALKSDRVGELVLERLEAAGFAGRRMSAHRLRHGMLTEVARAGAASSGSALTPGTGTSTRCAAT